MRVYETMIILDPDLEEQAARALVDRVLDVFRARGAQPRDVDWWGKRRLTYDIRHKLEGTYVVVTADAEPQAVEELHRVLALSDEVVRHKTVRLPESVATPLGESQSA